MRPWIVGALAGTAATVPMTAVMLVLHRRLPQPERYPLPPREIMEAVLEPVADSESSPNNRRMTALTLTAHFAYGAATGALYALLYPRGRAPVLTGSVYGVAVWAASYLGWIPAAKILKPATRHPRRRNALMIAAHLVWGGFTGFVCKRLATEGR